MRVGSAEYGTYMLGLQAEAHSFVQSQTVIQVEPMGQIQALQEQAAATNAQ